MKKLFFVIISLFILCEIIIISINLNVISFGCTGTYPPSTSPWPAGDILFTGDTFGTIDLYGCERFGSISRRATILKKFHDYLYLDFGNITRENFIADEAVFPLLHEALQHMRLNVLNVTKRDIINFSECGHEIHGIHLVSANLHIQAPGNRKNVILPYKLLPFRLRSSSENHEIKIGITGTSNNERKLHRGIVRCTAADIKQSLKKIMEGFKEVDLKILLFNDTFFELEKLLSDNDMRFDLVISSSTMPGHVNKMIRVHNNPVAFADEYGRSLGHVRVFKKDNRYSFEYSAYTLGMGISRDKKAKTLTRAYQPGMAEENGAKNKTSGEQR